jgi:hypothetical protein
MEEERRRAIGRPIAAVGEPPAITQPKLVPLLGLRPSTVPHLIHRIHETADTLVPKATVAGHPAPPPRYGGRPCVNDRAVLPRSGPG